MELCKVAADVSLPEKASFDKAKDYALNAADKPALSDEPDLSLKHSVDVEAQPALINDRREGGYTNNKEGDAKNKLPEPESETPKAANAKPTGESPSANRKGSVTKRGPRPLLRTSKYRGVSWFRANKVWKAQITVNGKYEYLGYFDLELDAAWAYDIRALEVHGPLAQLNFPDRIPELMKASASGVVPGKIKSKKKGRKRGRNKLDSVGSVPSVASLPEQKKLKVNVTDVNTGAGSNMYKPLALQAAMTGLAAQQQAGTDLSSFGVLGRLASSPITSDRLAALSSMQQPQGMNLVLPSPSSPSISPFSPSLTPNFPASPALLFEQQMRFLQQQQEHQQQQQQAAAFASDDSKRQLAVQLLAKLNIDSKMIAPVVGSTETGVRSWLAGTSNDTELADRIMWFLQKMYTDSISSPISSPKPESFQSPSEKSLRGLLLILVRQVELTPAEIQASLSMSPDMLQHLLPGGAARIEGNAVLSNNLRLLTLFVQIKLKQAGMNEMAAVLQTAAEAANVILK